MSGLRVADFDFESASGIDCAGTAAGARTEPHAGDGPQHGRVARCAVQRVPFSARPGDLLVLNDSRVIPARLYARRTVVRDRQAPSGLVEVLLTEPAGEQHMARAGEARQKGRRGRAAGVSSLFRRSRARGRGAGAWRVWRATVRFAPVQDFFAALERIGHMPLPPYIRRDDAEVDRERYQTVFARERGSVAAPTAGLHFTPEMLEAIGASGVEVARVTLHVGLGTFAPLRVENVDEVRLHRENYTLPATTAEAVNRARREGRRVVAVGTTVVRTLEAAAQIAGDGPLVAHTGTTDIFISPGFRFGVVGALLTNFHLPRSSLLMLVSAFAGREHVLAAYLHAVRMGYRFFSYGDCMFAAQEQADLEK